MTQKEFQALGWLLGILKIWLKTHYPQILPLGLADQINARYCLVRCGKFVFVCQYILMERVPSS